MGSGPYKLKSVTIGDRIVLEAVDKHWFYGVPRTKTLTYIQIPEEITRIALLKSGVSDLTLINQANLAAITAANFRTYVGLGTAQWQTIVPSQIDRPAPDGVNPLSKEDVRKALAWYAIDRGALFGSYFTGTGFQSMDFPVGPIDPAYDEATKEPIPIQDLNKARSLLAQAGYPRGFELDAYVVRSPTRSPEADEAVLAWWEQIGIKVNRFPLDTVQSLARAQTALKDGWKKPTVIMLGASMTQIAADIHVQIVHNPTNRLMTSLDPEAIRLATAFFSAKSVDEYKKNGRAYKKYVAEHLLSWWNLVAFREVYAGSSKMPGNWQASGGLINLVSAAATR